MAYANWLSPSPTSGNGNGTVNVSALSDNTGRNSRSTTVTFSAANCSDVTRTVAQAGKPEFSAIQSTAAVNKSGGTLTLTGSSNSKNLTFTKSNDNIGLTIPDTYTAAGVATNNGADITGDPGASQEYAFSIQFSVSENTDISAKTCQIIVTDDAGNDHTCTITLAAGDAYITIGTVSGDLPWDAFTDGDTVTITVESNTNWSIS